MADVYTLLWEGFKDILQQLLEEELDATLGYEKNQKGNMTTTNKRNFHSPKKFKSQFGEFQVDVSQDMSSIEEKVISLYGRGMRATDIHNQLPEIYGIELSAETVSKITDKILPEIRKWQPRFLNLVYPFMFMDYIHYKVRNTGGS